MTAGAYTVAVGEHGLATGFGDTGSVGIGGITLGGGIGYLVRKHGLTIDSLLAVEIVTADGQVVVADADRHPDLFWAIRGGGGSFGVVTRFRYRLHPVDTIVGGMLVLPATPEALAGFIAAADAAPEDLSVIANVMPCPPMPFVPAEHHGTTVILALTCFAGPVEEAEAAYAPFRALQTPLADLIRPMPYPELYPRRRRGTTRWPSPGRCSSTGSGWTRLAWRSRGSPRLMHRCASCSCASLVERRPACRTGPRPTRTGRGGSWPSSPRSTRARTTWSGASPGWRAFAVTCTRPMVPT